MILLLILLLTVGMSLSALFSGSETGFYRATRLRLVIEALGGDYLARGLLMLVNRPFLFVATILIGNNMANYLTSLAIVMTARLVAGDSPTVELVAPILLTPCLFVLGELLPKTLFLLAPNRLLRRVAPLLFIAVILFLPISLLLWGLGKLLSLISGEAPGNVRLALARRELRGAIQEGHEAGILLPAQQYLAQGIFNIARKPIGDYLEAMDHLPRVTTDTPRDELLRLAAEYRLAIMPVESPRNPGRLIGYYRVMELGLATGQDVPSPHPLLTFPADMPQLTAITEMEMAGESLALVVDKQQQPLGIVTDHELRTPLFSHSKGR